MGTWQNGYVERQQSQGHGKLVHASSMASNGVVAHPWAETFPEPSCNLVHAALHCNRLGCAISFQGEYALGLFSCFHVHPCRNVLHFHPNGPATKPWSHCVQVLKKTHSIIFCWTTQGKHLNTSFAYKQWSPCLPPPSAHHLRLMKTWQENPLTKMIKKLWDFKKLNVPNLAVEY